MTLNDDDDDDDDGKAERGKFGMYRWWFYVWQYCSQLDREDWSLVIFSVKKDANLSAREDVGREEGRIAVGLRCRMVLTVCQSLWVEACWLRS